MIYKGYEITAERNSWTQFEVIDEGELGATIGTDYDDEIRYAIRRNHFTSDYSYDSLDEAKQAIDERNRLALIQKSIKENMEYRGWKLTEVYHNGNKVKAEKDGKELYFPKLGISSGQVRKAIDALENEKIKLNYPLDN